MNIPNKTEFALQLIRELSAIGNYRQIGDLTINEFEKLSENIIEYFLEYQNEEEPPF